MNFALYSANSTSAELCFFTEQDLRAGRVSHSIQLDPALNRTGDVWHVQIPGVATDLLYGGRPLLLLMPNCEKLVMTQGSLLMRPLHCAGYRMGGLHQDSDRKAAGHRFSPVSPLHFSYHLFGIIYHC